MSSADDTTGAVRDHWPRHAAQWAHVGAPLRPSREDVAVIQAAVGGAAPRALVLGATRELVALDWPAGSVVTVVDRAPAMLAALPPGPARRVCGDWRALPCAAASVDVALGDGSLSVLSFPAEYVRIADELARALVPGGRLALRLFASPEAAERESLADVGAAIAARAIGSVHACKWRVAMAIAGGGDVAVADIARAFDALCPDREALADHTGWAPAAIATIDAYRGSTARYSFPTRAAALAALAPRFELLSATTPTYELGERCPTVVLAARHP